ncbi:hypothetical protein [Halobacterium zhouii]|uniref:hypothetical protein n=1 Tax=Halobacterium zhouii TaxID=2902624 RepID=UPI001E2DAE66|nr:hypothetical protein [Halobacterium zhouii]
MTDQQSTRYTEEQLAEAYKNLSEDKRETIKTESYNRAHDKFDNSDALREAHHTDENEFRWVGLEIEVTHAVDVNQDWGFTLISGVNAQTQPETHDVAYRFLRVWLAELKTELRGHLDEEVEGLNALVELAELANSVEVVPKEEDGE